MNAVVAIGGPPLLRAAQAYRALEPSAVWILGLKTPRDPRDPLLRSLESLVEPLMAPYFAAVAQAQVAAMSSQLTNVLLPSRVADPAAALHGLSETLWKDVAGTLALVQMLDGAHAIAPVELVLNDDSSALARTAVAWAQARGLPSVTIPARTPLRRPRQPSADRTIVVGERAKRVYRALDVDEARLVSIAAPKVSFADGANERAARRSQAKAALIRAMSWSETDIVVLFEPAAAARDSALEPTNAYRASFAAMFSALLIARASVPTLRLAVVAPSSVHGFTFAAEAAKNAGVAATDFAYSETDHDVWMAAADIAVSVDSTRSIDACAAGVSAINLWRPANWYLGPSFAAEDGILDVAPAVLGATLIALANNPDLRAQIAKIAGDRVCRDTAIASTAADAVARALVKQRRPAPAVAVKTKADIVICAPPYWHGSAGHRALYRLCHFINLLGRNASIYPGNHPHPDWNTPKRDIPITDETICVYPEIYARDLYAKRVVRWCLNKPGLLGGPKSYDADEMVFYFHHSYREAAQAATSEILTDERVLQIGLTEPEWFYNDRARSRLYDCVFVYKGQALYDRVQPRQIRDAYLIQPGWPASRVQTAALLRGCRRLYSFDGSSAIVAEAIICGVETYLVNDDGLAMYTGTDGWGVENYAEQYYDMGPVERFLRLLDERWG